MQTKHLKQAIIQVHGEFCGVNDNGEIMIVPTTYVKPNEYDYFYLKGLTGERYGISELDNISKIYGYGYGASTTTNARSIKIEDVNKITGYNPLNTGVYDSNQTVQGIPCYDGQIDEYGNEVTYLWDGTTLPYYLGLNGVTGNLEYGHEVYGFNWFDSLLKGYTSNYTTKKSEIIKLKCTRQYYYGTTLTESESGTVINDSSSAKYGTVFVGSSYWLASPFVNTDPYNADFGLHRVNISSVDTNNLYASSGYSHINSNGVRPVVYLKSDISLKKTGDNNWAIQ